jgi:hypothetical protein
MRNQSVADVVSDWIADRRLPRRKLAFLRLVYDQFHDAPASCVDTACRIVCSELDLPPGSATIQVIAALLDHIDPLPEHQHHRLIEVTDKLVVDGAWGEDAAEAFYAEVL